MSVDIKVLERAGCSSGEYRRIFTADPSARPTRVNKLIQLIADRTRSGRDMNLENYRTHWAIDLADEASNQQITPTLIKSFLDRKWKDGKEAFEALSSWGLKEIDVFVDVKLEDGTAAKMMNPPFLYQIIVPIVNSYVTSQLSKIFNERDTDPLLPYTPLKLTTRNQVLCEVLTDVVNTISTWYGYSAVMKDAIRQMLKYGIALAFPREKWHSEKQEAFEDYDDTKQRGKTVTTKEGIRYYFPHPTRMYYDMLHPLSTFNSDTGCEYAGYWHIVRYGDILDNRDYWNRDSIWFGTNWFSDPIAQNYFALVYPCQLQFPEIKTGMKREDKAAYYSTATRDKAVFQTEHFMKLVPKDWGLGQYEDEKLKKLVKTYSYPVWHRFVIAGDDTVIFCEPLPYAPVWFMGYNYDPQRSSTSSLALEVIPWQDEIGNILSQMILTTKQNLANVTFYDQYVIKPEDINKLKNSGSSQYAAMNFIPVDTMKHARLQGLNSANPFWPAQLTKQSIQESLQMMGQVLSMMERVLQISAQDTGSAASHQQSKAEIVQTGGSSTNRLNFTSSFVDDGIDAWQRQLHDGWQSFGNSDIEAAISPDLDNLDEVLKELGFETTEKTKDEVFVKGSKTALKTLRLESFARRNNGPAQAEDAALAQVIFSVIGTIAGQPELVQRVGPDNLLILLEEGIRLGGGRKDFAIPRMKKGQATDPVPANVTEAIKSALQAFGQTIEEKIAKPIAGELHGEQQKIQQIEQVLQQLQGIYKVAAAAQEKTAIKKQESAVKLQIKQQESIATQKRKDAEAAASIQRQQKVAAGKLTIEAKTAGARAATHAASEHSKNVVAAHSEGVAAAASATKAKESISINYSDAPASVQRQMESAAGFQPASESVAEIKNQKSPPKAQDKTKAK